jgi:ABC-type uncharacterized transport system permease subunit
VPRFRFQPSTRLIAGIALALFSFTLVGVGLHHLIEGGTCSSTGYSANYGPVPKCPEGTGWWMAFLIGGILLGIGGAILAGAPNLVVPGLFTAIGLGAVTVAVSNSDESGSVLFGIVFGGSFLIGGLAYPVYAGVKWLRGQRGAHDGTWPP